MKNFTAHMIFRCLFALLILGGLAFADYLILNLQLRTQRHDAALINVSGRQRMLVERIAFLSRYMVGTQDLSERYKIRQQLVEAIGLLETYQNAMINGDENLELPGNPPQEIRKIYFEPPNMLNTRLKNYLTEVKALSQARNEEMSEADPRLVTIRNVSSGKILYALDAVVNQYQRLSEAKNVRSQQLQMGVLGSTLFILLITGFFIFRPMVRRVRHEMNQLENVNEILESSVEEHTRAEEALKKAVSDLVDSNMQFDKVSHELKVVNAKLENIASLDPLTQLLNRRGLQQALSREIYWAEREGTETLVLMVDLDNFKTINDTLGYAIGDIVLKEVSKRIQTCIRFTDYLSRIGGDEFIILLPQTRLAEGTQVANKIRLAISGAVITLTSGQTLRTTASVGVCTVSKETPSIDELLTQIYPVLAHSKRGGKNTVSYHGELDRHEQDQSLSAVLEKLRAGNSIRVVKQPIFRLVDRKITGYELLCRAAIDAFEMPDVFFRIALENNMLTLLDHQCFKACVAKSKEVSNGLCCHLNLFPSTMVDVPISHLLETIPSTRDFRNYCIEISEQQIIGEPSYLIEFVNAIKETGVMIAIDDVGFGHSCLESLILLEPNIIKIDKKCVNRISQDATRARSLRRLLNVVTPLGTDVIAEGIEWEKDLELLTELGVKYGQGFLLGKPL